jgi:large subunit ribosomal protein L18
MATKKEIRRFKLKMRIRKKVSGTSERPRLTVFRSNKEIYVQLLDVVKGFTLAFEFAVEKIFEHKGKDRKRVVKEKRGPQLLN